MTAATHNDDRAARVLLVCSSGGHLLQMHQLQPWWSRYERVWVTFDKPDARSLLQGEQVAWAHHPTTRSVRNTVRNAVLAWRLIRRFRPQLMVSTGAAVGFSFAVVARLLRVKTAYIELFDRISLTGRLCYRVVDAFAVQWPEQLDVYPRAVLIGPLL